MKIKHRHVWVYLAGEDLVCLDFTEKEKYYWCNSCGAVCVTNGFWDGDNRQLLEMYFPEDTHPGRGMLKNPNEVHPGSIYGKSYASPQPHSWWRRFRDFTLGRK